MRDSMVNRARSLHLVSWLLVVSLIPLAVAQGSTVLGIADSQCFTIDGVPTFLYQLAYLGLTAIPTEVPGTPPPPLDVYGSWPGVLDAQLECIQEQGINCVRVWAHWGHYVDNHACSMFPMPPEARDPDHWDRIFAVTDSLGRCDDAPADVRPLYQRNMNRLRTVIEACDARGIIVELTFARPSRDFPWAWPFPRDHFAHRASLIAVCDRLQGWRGAGSQFKNVYFDVANESWDGITLEEIAELASLVTDERYRSTDGTMYRWLCTCGNGGWFGPWTIEQKAAQLDAYVLAGLDFVAPTIGGGSGEPQKCFRDIRAIRTAMQQDVPWHINEPFRVGAFGGATPDESDFFRACTGSRAAGVVGWCLHTLFYVNYGNYYVTRGDLTYSCTDEMGNEFGDPWGITAVVFDDMLGQFGYPDAMNPRVSRYHAEYDEQLRPSAADAGHAVFSAVGRPYPQPGSYGPPPWGWEAQPSDGAGLITWGPDAHSDHVGWGTATLRMAWVGSAVTTARVATVTVYDRWDGGQAQLGRRHIYGDDLGSAGQYVDVTVPFHCAYAGADIDVDIAVAGRTTLRLDFIQLDLPSPAGGDAGRGASSCPALQPLAPRLAWSVPNPFHRSARLAFSLPSNAAVSLAIYDAGGRTVARLVDDALMVAGTHSVVWTPPQGLPRGVYPCRFVAGDHSETIELVYLGRR